MPRSLLPAVLVGLLLAPVGTAHATSQLLGFGPSNIFSPSAALHWSVDFPGATSVNFGGSLGLVYPMTYGNGTYAIAAHRDFLHADSRLSLNVTGAGDPTSPSHIQTLQAEHHLDTANTNQYGFFAFSDRSRFLWRFGGDDPTVYWVAEWMFQVTATNDLASANFSISDSFTNTPLVDMPAIHGSGIFTGTAFGSNALSSGLSFDYASGVVSSQTDITLMSQVRWVFSSEPITEFPTGAVPEPASLLLLGSGLAVWRMRKRLQV